MKTPMQKLIEKLEKMGMTLSTMDIDKTEHLEEEKQVIIEAFDSGTAYSYSDSEYDAHDYFKETFKND